jgi:hypothetical protein
MKLFFITHNFVKNIHENRSKTKHKQKNWEGEEGISTKMAQKSNKKKQIFGGNFYEKKNMLFEKKNIF